MELARVVVQAKQERADVLVFAVLVPAEACHDTVRRTRVLHLDHRALAWLVDSAFGLRDHAVEAGALEASQPVLGDGTVARHRREMNRRTALRQRLLEQRAAFRLRRAAQIAIAGCNQIERHERRRRLLRELRHARRGRMEPELQRIEVEPLWRRDDDLAVNHASGRDLVEKRVVQLREVPVERSKIAALNEDIGGRAEHDRAESIPFGLVQEPTLGRQLLGELREHGLDWRLDGGTHCRTVYSLGARSATRTLTSRRSAPRRMPSLTVAPIRSSVSSRCRSSRRATATVSSATMMSPSRTPAPAAGPSGAS